MGLENARLKMTENTRGSENAVLENDGQTFSKLWNKTDKVLANSENIPFVIVYNEQL